MLIDDNKIDLYINQRIIEKYNPNVKTSTFSNALSAISFFKLLESDPKSTSCGAPDVILLDVNMPEINGFDFLQEFEGLEHSNKRDISIYMLSSSICPDEIQKAQKYNCCAGYITKPLTENVLKNVVFQGEACQNLRQFKITN